MSHTIALTLGKVHHYYVYVMVMQLLILSEQHVCWSLYDD